MTLLLAVGLLLLPLGQSVAGEKCPTPQYPVNIEVLMDSNTGASYVSSRANCQNCKNIYVLISQQSFPRCGGGLCYGDPQLETHYINLRANMYPVQIFVNITYSFTECQTSNCSGDLELQILAYGMTIIHNIQNNREVSNGTRAFAFDANTLTAEFYLTLRSIQACVTVSRVLVYRYECPGHDSTGLGYRPTTPAPASGAVMISTERTYTYVTYTTVQDALICTSQGKWLECEYSENEVTCKGKM